MSDRGIPTKKKDKKIKPKVKPIVLSSDSEEEPEVKKEKPVKIYDNYKEACSRKFDKYVIS
jgi:hypothetical protein